MTRIRTGELEINDRLGLPQLVDGLARRLLDVPGADPAVFARITLSPKRVGVVHGQCRYPRPAKGRGPGAELARHGYIITAAARADRNAYPLTLQHWGAMRAPQAKQGWRSGAALYRFDQLEAAAGFVLAHELAHVALRQKWLKAKNTEAVTNAVAVIWCRDLGFPIAVRPARSGDRVMPADAVVGLARPDQLWLW